MNVLYQLIGFGALIAMVTYETPMTLLTIITAASLLKKEPKKS